MQKKPVSFSDFYFKTLTNWSYIYHSWLGDLIQLMPGATLLDLDEIVMAQHSCFVSRRHLDFRLLDHTEVPSQLTHYDLNLFVRLPLIEDSPEPYRLGEIGIHVLPGSFGHRGLNFPEAFREGSVVYTLMFYCYRSMRESYALFPAIGLVGVSPDGRTDDPAFYDFAGDVFETKDDPELIENLRLWINIMLHYFSKINQTTIWLESVENTHSVLPTSEGYRALIKPTF